MKLAFLASHNGSAMRAIVAAMANGQLAGEAVLVVSNKRDAPALSYARAQRIVSRHIPTLPDPDAADSALREALLACGADLVILSGYLRKIGPQTLAAFGGKILNIHPSLLPKYGGEGMYGRHVHEAVAAAGDAESGATIHLVDAVFDQGPIVAQKRVSLPSHANADAIAQAVTAIEPSFFVETLQRIAAGDLNLAELAQA